NFFPRIDYSVFVLHIPRLTGKELYQAICYKLKMIYPGNLNDFEIIIKKNGKLKGSYVVFIITKDLPKKPVPISTLMLQQLLKGKTATAFYVDSDHIEIIKIEQGAINESIIKRAENISDISTYIKTYCSNKVPIEIFCDKNNLQNLVQDLKAFMNNENINFRSIEDSIKEISFDSICLYNQYNPRKKYIKISSFIFSVAVVLIILYGLYQYKIALEENNRQVREEQLYIERKLQNEKNQKEKLLNLEKEYINLIERKRLKPFEILNAVSSSLDKNVLIISLTVKENNFQMEALALDSLKILRNFENNKQINNIKMNQIHPDQGRERFTINGTVLATRYYVAEDNIIEERIKLFEALIHEEKEQSYGEGFTDSIFGMSIRDILRSCNCLIKSYQYLGYGNEKEIEFSIQASSRNFFNFLKIASLPLYNWDFSIVQIRNLLPRDTLDVVIRIRADFDTDNSNSLKTIPEKEIEKIEKEIAEIARNYYIASPKLVARREASVVAKEQGITRREFISWLSYVGRVGDANGAHYIYMKNTRDSCILKFEINGSSDMSCKFLDSGNIEVVMDNRVYEVKKER
ncbi:MAG: hypothetical protein FWE72_09460, partial [Spirochaetaceae bacterium]|nr:hypothetical protein [Spirochaetaceae bacterium]